MIQSAHESACGNSGLARNHNNLFGIVATDSWKKRGGMIAEMPTWEEIKGNRVEMKREFRAYATWRDSFFDWSRLITTVGVYKKAYELLKDKATVPAGIEEMAKVYATDSKYARKLLDLYHQVVPT
jgi:flagellar protein FlgJ